nr:hypothetical protein [Pseudomonas aeruginosa]
MQVLDGRAADLLVERLPGDGDWAGRFARESARLAASPLGGEGQPVLALDQQIGRAPIQYLHRQAHARHRPVGHAQLRLAVQRPAQPLQRRHGIGRGVQAHADNGIFRPLGMAAPGAGLQGRQRESFERFARGRLHSGLQVF